MAKEFKDYDRKFAHCKGKALELLVSDRIITSVFREIIDDQTSWYYKKDFREDYSHEEVRIAVYLDHWQRYRVGMKGLSTREKLYVCSILWGFYVDSLELANWRIRINNYIGALKRGGFLDTDLNIIKG